MMNRMFPASTRYIRPQVQERVNSPPVIAPPTPRKINFRFVVNCMDTRLQLIPQISPMTNVVVEGYRVYDHGWHKTNHNVEYYFPSIGKPLFEPTASLMIPFYHPQYELDDLITDVKSMKCLNSIIVYPKTKECITSAVRFVNMLQDELANSAPGTKNSLLCRVSLLIDTSFGEWHSSVENLNVPIDYLYSINQPDSNISAIGSKIVYLNYPKNATKAVIEGVLDSLPSSVKCVVVMNFKLYEESMLEEYFYTNDIIVNSSRSPAFDDELDIQKKADLLNKILCEGERTESIVKVYDNQSQDVKKRTFPYSQSNKRFKNDENESSSEEEETAAE